MFVNNSNNNNNNNNNNENFALGTGSHLSEPYCHKTERTEEDSEQDAPVKLRSHTPGKPKIL